MTNLVPARELERLDALHASAIMHTEPEPHFDAVCRLARRLFNVPIAYIALLDADSQWFKACCGLDVTSTARNLSFCARTILFDTPHIVRDAAADPRYASNPFVAGPAGIRFYAGVPLALEPELRIGTLCLMDTVPRCFDPEQMEQLEDFAPIVIAHLRLHEAEHVLAGWKKRAADARTAFESFTKLYSYEGRVGTA